MGFSFELVFSKRRRWKIYRTMSGNFNDIQEMKKKNEKDLITRIVYQK